MAGLGDLFGTGSAVSQIFIYGVAQQIVQALLSPTLELVAQKINSENPVIDLSPADLANLVVRSYRDQASAADEAAHSGINADRFADMVHLATDAPSPGDLATALRRGIIPESGSGPDSVSFDQGIREGRIGNKWISMVKDLAVQWPSPTDALDALLEGQISYSDGVALYQRLGGDPQFFQLLYNTRGNAPTPTEALDLANRGIIPWSGTGPDAVSYEQAFLEGPWRNKWLKPFESLGQYLPPPRTVTAMVSSGALTPDQGTQLLIKQGLTADLAAAYIHDALNSKSQKERDLTESQLLDMYSSGLISAGDVTPLLKALGYDEQSIGWLLAYRDLQRAIAATNSAVSRIHTLYTTHKIAADVARNALAQLKVPGDQVAGIVQAWGIERSANVATLTAAQIADAAYLDIITTDEALTELVALGYTPHDAWVYLSIKFKGPITTTAKPAQGPAPIASS